LDLGTLSQRLSSIPRGKPSLYNDRGGESSKGGVNGCMASKIPGGLVMKNDSLLKTLGIKKRSFFNVLPMGAIGPQEVP